MFLSYILQTHDLQKLFEVVNVLMVSLVAIVVLLLTLWKTANALISCGHGTNIQLEENQTITVGEIEDAPSCYVVTVVAPIYHEIVASCNFSIGVILKLDSYI